MIPLELLPASLRTATVEEQLSYLLKRLDTIERLVGCLEAYSVEQEAAGRQAAAAPLMVM